MNWEELERLAAPGTGDCKHSEWRTRKDCDCCNARTEMRRIRLAPIIQALEPWNEEINDKWSRHDSIRQAEDVLRKLNEVGLKIVPISDQDVIAGLQAMAAETI